jgi:hypothetical protein
MLKVIYDDMRPARTAVRVIFHKCPFDCSIYMYKIYILLYAHPQYREPVYSFLSWLLVQSGRWSVRRKGSLEQME